MKRIKFMTREDRMNVTVNGETAIKPYYYLRNGVLHIRYTVDRCIKLSPAETEKLKKEMDSCPYDKQLVLAEAWNFFACFVRKNIIMDGVAELGRKIRELKENGCKN